MVLPPFEASTGEVETSHAWLGGDARIPTPLRTASDDYFREDHPPRVVAHYLACVGRGERHLWDIVESTNVREVEDEHGDYQERTDFRARLTCVRCGVVQAWEGEREDRHVGCLQVEPLIAGDLVAQMVTAERGAFGARDMSSWEIYRAGRRVGRMTWGSGVRGRAFHTARLEAWPVGEHVEGPTPAAALRKLARRCAETVPA